VSSFDEWKAYGQLGEQMIGGLYRQRGWFVQPSFLYQPYNGHGPAFSGSEHDVLVADLDVAKAGQRKWVEVKSLWESPYYGLVSANTHGVSDRCWKHYCKLEEQTGSQVTLAILEVSTGHLLERELAYLRQVAIACGCRGCRGKDICTATQGKLVYFKRNEFWHTHSFQDDEMAAIRQAHPKRKHEAVCAN
jgi:hypothetical protein